MPTIAVRTTQADMEAELAARLGGARWFASFFGADLNWAPDPAAALRATPAIARIGTYEPVVRTVHGTRVAVLERTGGRWVTGLRVASARPVTAVFGWRDADGAERLHRPCATDAHGFLTFPTATFPCLGGDEYLEGWTVIRPAWTLTARDGELRYASAGRSLRWPLPGGTLGDAQVTPAGDALVFVMRGSRTIWRADLATGALRRFAVVPDPVARLEPRGDRILAHGGARAVATVTRGGSVIGTAPAFARAAPPAPAGEGFRRRSANLPARGVDALLGG